MFAAKFAAAMALVCAAAQAQDWEKDDQGWNWDDQDWSDDDDMECDEDDWKCRDQNDGGDWDTEGWNDDQWNVAQDWDDQGDHDHDHLDWDDQDPHFADWDCEGELSCVWLDCNDWEKHEDIYGEMECWKEECFDDCGDYLCVIWHWDEQYEEWVEDECGDGPMFEDFGDVDWEDQQMMAADQAEDVWNQTMAVMPAFNNTIGIAMEAFNIPEDPEEMQAQFQNDTMQYAMAYDQAYNVTNSTMDFMTSLLMAADQSPAKALGDAFIDDANNLAGEEFYVAQEFRNATTASEGIMAVAETLQQDLDNDMSEENSDSWFNQLFGWFGN